MVYDRNVWTRLQFCPLATSFLCLTIPVRWRSAVREVTSAACASWLLAIEPFCLSSRTTISSNSLLADSRCSATADGASSTRPVAGADPVIHREPSFYFLSFHRGRTLYKEGRNSYSALSYPHCIIHDTPEA